MSDRASTSDVLLREFAHIHAARGGAGNLNDEITKLESHPAWSKLLPEDKNARRQSCYVRQVHALVAAGGSDGQTALCLSGGGIRSAAFALGVMQGLAEKKLLSKFHYLSTVSGGGYIGGWLTTWARRPDKNKDRRSFVEIETELAGASAAEPLKELRRRKDFLTPRTGVASPDSWAALAHVVRNLLLNWLVFVPLLAALLLLPRIAEGVLILWVAQTPATIDSSLLEIGRWLCPWPWSPSSTFGMPWQSWLDTAGMLVVAFGLAFSMANRSVRSREAISDGTFVAYALAPILFGAFLLLMATAAWYANGHVPNRTELLQWSVLCGVVFVSVRLVAAFYTWLKGLPADHRLLLELLAQALSGALVGAVIWAGLMLRYAAHPGEISLWRDVAVFGLPWFLMSFLVGQTVLAGLTSYLFRETGDSNREWLARASGWYGAAALGWLAGSWVVLYGWDEFYPYYVTFTGFTFASGVASLFGGATPLTKATSAAGLAKNVRASTVVAVLSVVFILCLMVWLAHATLVVLQSIVDIRTVGPSSLGVPLDRGLASYERTPRMTEAFYRLGSVSAAAVLLLFFSLIASYFVNVNYFSLNALYRNRLVRAFLGSSNIAPITGKEPDCNPFDGFAEADNVAMADLEPTGTGAPFPIVNMTLNLTATKDNAWQERKAASFVSTPFHTGGDLVGYRPSKEYAAGPVPEQQAPPTADTTITPGITLGTAMSISGAAASPNWGYHSSPVTSFLLAFFNIRLGCWLGNPASEDTWRLDGPVWAPQLVWQEALGRTSDDSSYVYLSDGGHFENLGLYEMVRRRCHVIVVSDAGADPSCSLEDLGNAIRKVFVDLGVEIKFDRVDVSKRGPGGSNPGIYCAVGRIIYPPAENAPEGKIIYIKPGLYNDAPADVRAYAAANANFPHDTTLNQWFTESQFESYRALGQHAIRMIASKRDAAGAVQSGGRVQDLAAFAECAMEYASGHAARSVAPTRVSLVS